MKNELGNKYGRLTVVEFAGTKPTNHGKSRLAMWLCSCECGMTVVVNGHDLRRGNTNSCGCYARDKRLEANSKHGDSKRGGFARLYRIWANINTRCGNPNCKEYDSYGGKGVRNEFESYEAFKEWAYANGYYDQDPKVVPSREMLSIDRIDPSKGYSPTNCRWISLSENARLRNEEYWKLHGNPSGSRKTRATTTR